MTENKLLEKLPEDFNLIHLPELGESMEDGTIVGIVANIGDEIKQGDIIFEIETDKATVEMQSPCSGIVKAILVELYDTIAVNSPVMIVGDGNVEISSDLVETLKKNNRITDSEIMESRIEGDVPDVNADGIISAANEQADVQYEPGQVFTQSRMQKLTAQRMMKSKREIPCFYLNARVDVSDLVKYRNQVNESQQSKVSYNDFIIKAVGLGLKRFELMTGQLDGDNIRLAESIGIGLAVDTGGGLVAPVIKDADEKSLAEIVEESKSLIEKAQNNKLHPNDLQGGCITVSNLGSLGVDSFIPIVIPGQCSILGVGQITETLLPEPKEPQVRKIICLSLSVDHRVVNGAYAGQFLDYVRKILEDITNFN